MRRGDIVTVAAGSGYGGKPRPAIVVQSDDFAETASVTVCLLTSYEVHAPLLRLALEPNGHNNLTARSWMMVDKILTVPRTRTGKPVGSLTPDEISRLDRGLLVFLGLAG